MSLGNILYTIIIGPLKLVFETIFAVVEDVIDNPVLSIAVLSLTINILVLPLYRRSDALQKEARDVDSKLAVGVKHIKKTFSGDERMMVLQTYYRQNNYKPTDVIKGSVSLLLQIPFFMAAYDFLVNLDAIKGVQLGPISDLGAPDGLISMNGISINLLPIIMTLINFVSSAIYLKGYSNKNKIQLYGIAIFFFVVLYSSPAGLVFYWTLNNVFSLVKNIFYKIKNPKKTLNLIMALLGVIVLNYGVFICDTSVGTKVTVILVGILLIVPFVTEQLKIETNIGQRIRKEIGDEYDGRILMLGNIFLTILVGLLIPSSVLAASPQEFVDVTYFYNPLWYVGYSLCFAIGTFMVWIRVFYWLANPTIKVVMDRLICILSVVMLVNYLFFGTKLGIISSYLKYEEGFGFGNVQKIINLLVIVIITIFMYVMVSKRGLVAKHILTIAIIAMSGMALINVSSIHKSVYELRNDPSFKKQQTPELALSKNGKNVIVIVLDRAMGSYVPYMMKEIPELKEKYAGFTYYANIMSYGTRTNFGAPPLFGGYEYTPVEMNKRDTESLVSKHNESLKVMPVIFDEEGYQVTVCDVPYGNYSLLADMSIYDEYPDINTYVMEGYFQPDSVKEEKISSLQRNFFYYSVMKTLPLVAQETIYNDGHYNQGGTRSAQNTYSSQVFTSKSSASGISSMFMNSFSVIQNMVNITKISDDNVNTFFMMKNMSTHEPTLLQTPEYTVEQYVDNTSYIEENKELYTIDGVTLKMERQLHITHYNANIGVLLELGMWLDYLRENGVYDNTKIIIVSDHGQGLGQIEQLVLDDSDLLQHDVAGYYPLLMVKDYGDKEFSVSYEFMTNADVPTIAFEGDVDNPVNPFTGKEINNDEKTAHKQYVITSQEWDVSINNGNTFLPSTWYSVEEDIWDLDNWTYYEDEVLLPEGVEY